MNLKVNYERIIIFDPTLRDSVQSPGNSINLEENLLVAAALDAGKHRRQAELDRLS